MTKLLQVRVIAIRRFEMKALYQTLKDVWDSSPSTTTPESTNRVNVSNSASSSSSSDGKQISSHADDEQEKLEEMCRENFVMKKYGQECRLLGIGETLPPMQL